MKIDYNNINSIEIGKKYILDNNFGIIENVEKTKVVAEVIEFIDEKKVKVKINSMLNKTEIESIIDFYLLK